MRAEKPFSLRIGVRRDWQLLDTPVAGQQVRRLDRHQATLADPLRKVPVGLTEFLRPALNVRLDRRQVRIAFAPLLDVPPVQKSHLLQQFQRPHRAVAFQTRLGTLADPLPQAVRFAL